MKLKNLTIPLLCASCLAGCTTMGTNVSGSFRCDAPDGICAPSTVIDDSAIARIEETSSSDLLNPAGPFQMDDGIDAPVHNTILAAAPAVSRAAPAYELAVVFPGYTDASGTPHARRVVKTQASLPGRGDRLDALAARGRAPSRNQGLLAAAESAPPYLAVAPGLLDVAAVSEGTGPQVAEASENPVKAIEARVNQRLSAHQTARRQAASFPGTVE